MRTSAHPRPLSHLEGAHHVLLSTKGENPIGQESMPGLLSADTGDWSSGMIPA
jgi:hypothetical protein